MESYTPEILQYKGREVTHKGSVGTGGHVIWCGISAHDDVAKLLPHVVAISQYSRALVLCALGLQAARAVCQP